MIPATYQANILNFFLYLGEGIFKFIFQILSQLTTGNILIQLSVKYLLLHQKVLF